uniref:WAT1-related protein n=1 Tax=Ananas comosus var. bracteatus TaxID=296719 RepID=A0A6V7PJV7_ANACO|nr:unnamed protein product [Ananas comosus var. bracteatus]
MGWWREWGPVAVMLAVDVGFAVMNVMIKKEDETKTYRRDLCLSLLQCIIWCLSTAVPVLCRAAIYVCDILMRIPQHGSDIHLPHRFTVAVGDTGPEEQSWDVKVARNNHMPEWCNSAHSLPRPSPAHKHSTQTLIKPYHMGYSSNTKQWMVGSIALLAGCLFWASWFLLQSKVCKKYPAIYSATALIFSLSFVQASALSLATQKSISVWVLKKKLEIVTVVFSGVVGSGLGFLAMSWCVGKRGPVFTAAFTPLIQIMVAAFDFSVLHEQLHLGSILGSALVIMGLYFLLWGKSKEAQLSNGVKPNEEHVEQALCKYKLFS